MSEERYNEDHYREQILALADWKEGEPVNLGAAILDALDWLEIMRSTVYQFSFPDPQEGAPQILLSQCMFNLAYWGASQGDIDLEELERLRKAKDKIQQFIDIAEDISDLDILSDKNLSINEHSGDSS